MESKPWHRTQAELTCALNGLTDEWPHIVRACAKFAVQHTEHAVQIAGLLESRICDALNGILRHTPAMPVMHVIHQIMLPQREDTLVEKNTRLIYVNAFRRNFVELFCSIFSTADALTRCQLCEMARELEGVIPMEVLVALDKRVTQMDLKLRIFRLIPQTKVRKPIRKRKIAPASEKQSAVSNKKPLEQKYMDTMKKNQRVKLAKISSNSASAVRPVQEVLNSAALHRSPLSGYKIPRVNPNADSVKLNKQLTTSNRPEIVRAYRRPLTTAERNDFSKHQLYSLVNNPQFEDMVGLWNIWQMQWQHREQWDLILAGESFAFDPRTCPIIDQTTKDNTSPRSSSGVSSGSKTPPTDVDKIDSSSSDSSDSDSSSSDSSSSSSDDDSSSSDDSSSDDEKI